MAAPLRARGSDDVEGADERSRLLPGGKKAQEERSRLESEVMRSFSLICIGATCWLSAGIVYLHFAERFSFIKALYICTQVVTTIGYGDFNLRSRYAYQFMSLYIFGCMILGAWVLGQLMSRITALQIDFFKGKLRHAEQRCGYAKHDEDAKKLFGQFNDIVASALLLVFVLGFGTVFFHLWEGCTCEKEGNPIVGCLESNCLGTGGVTLSYGSALYMSIVTLATVGFGDRHPESELGMLVATGWMIVGVGAFANFIRAVSVYCFKHSQEKSYLLSKHISEKTFRQMDLDGNGFISRAEFRRYMLLKFQLIDKEIIDILDRQYDALDGEQTNKVSFDDIAALYDADTSN